MDARQTRRRHGSSRRSTDRGKRPGVSSPRVPSRGERHSAWERVSGHRRRVTPDTSGNAEHVREGRRIHKRRDALPGKRPEYTEPRDAARENDDRQLICRAPIHRHGFRTDLSLRIYRALRRRTPKGMNFRRWLDAPRRSRQCHRHDCGLRHYLACRTGDNRLNVGRKSCKCAAQIVVFV
jgi:hypothetical protein